MKQLYYPSALNWMWNYCIYLGPFTDSTGHNYDLGVHLGNGTCHSGAIVDGNEPGNYFSGELRDYINGDYTNDVMAEKYIETIKRAKYLGYI